MGIAGIVVYHGPANSIDIIRDHLNPLGLSLPVQWAYDTETGEKLSIELKKVGNEDLSPLEFYRFCMDGGIYAHLYSFDSEVRTLLIP